MKIFNALQLKQADKLTIQRQNISSDELMERAGLAAFNWFKAQLGESKVPIHIFCGVGNNGGDGLVLARHLLENDYQVSVYVVNFSEHRSPDFLKNYDRIKALKLWPNLLTENEQFPAIGANEVVVDAIFGVGLNRPPANWVVALIQHINTASNLIVSIDLPSGMYLDKPLDAKAVINANFVLSFQFPKLPFFLPETGGFVKFWQLLPIGIDPQFIQEEQPQAHYVDQLLALQWYRQRDRFAHKGNFGHALLIGGSYGKIGAILLSCRGALQAGAGLVTAYVPKCGYQVLQTAQPEVMVLTDAHEKHLTAIDYGELKPSVVGIGPGMGTHIETAAAFEAFLKKCEAPLVIDADGLNLLAANPTLLKLLEGRAILTPHPKELERLIGTWTDDFDKLQKLQAFTQAHQVIVVLKGAHSMVVFQDHWFVNGTGNPGMATAGSGDVLTGVITALVGQGYPLLQATVLGVYLHGKAGDLVASTKAYEGVIASDIAAHLGAAVLDTLRPKNTSTQKQ